MGVDMCPCVGPMCGHVFKRVLHAERRCPTRRTFIDAIDLSILVQKQRKMEAAVEHEKTIK